jgi:hypothetical protein
MFAKPLSSRSLGVLALGAGLSSFFLLIFPYYYSPQSYIPKNNPALGYYMPNTLEAWIVLAVALLLLLFSMFLIVIYAKRRAAEGKWVNKPLPSLHQKTN